MFLIKAIKYLILDSVILKVLDNAGMVSPFNLLSYISILSSFVNLLTKNCTSNLVSKILGAVHCELNK